MSDSELTGHMTYVPIYTILLEAHCVCNSRTLIFAAMDTTSSALARILYKLAEHPGAQAKLRQELSDAKKSGEHMTYDELTSQPYLDAVVRETLRLCVLKFIVFDLRDHS